MKFAKVLQQTLVEDDLPQEWVEAAIQYKVLKKFIGKVVKELDFLGLSQTNLKLLLQDEELNSTVEMATSEATPCNPIVAHYTLKKSRTQIVPYLKIVLNNDESAEQYSSDDIHALADQIRAKLQLVLSTDDEDRHIIELKEEEDQFVLSPTATHEELDVDSLVKVQNQNEIVVMLNSDTKFFRMLNLELQKLDEIRETEEQKLVNEIDALSQTVLLLTKKRLDLYTWREFFRIYLDSEVYFRYNEATQSGLERSGEQVKKNLAEFASRVETAHIVDRFKSKLAVGAYANFLEMNARLLKIIQYQSINTTALRKILKKFDKRTCLNVSAKFPELISQDHVFINGSSVAQSICFVMQNKLLTLIPQLEDYTCPICMSVAFKPIRLDCGHIFCVRCLIKTKQRGRTDCPLCRYSDAILLADSRNLDHGAMELIKKNFPLEVKEKLREIDKEKYDDVVNHKNCVLM